MDIQELVDQCKCGVYLSVNEYRDEYATIGEVLESFVLTRGETDAERAHDASLSGIYPAAWF